MFEMRDFSAPGPVVVYDGACPFCAGYMRLLRLREAAGPVTLVDARGAGHPVLDRVRAAGLDLDRGIVVALGEALHHGAAAMTVLAALSTRSGMVNRTMAWAFRSQRRARLLYPPLALGRGLVLRLLGRPRIGRD